MSVTEQILGSPNVSIDLETSRDYHASIALHVAELSHTCHVLSLETAQCFSILEIVKHDGAIKGASRNAKRIQDLAAVGDQV